MHVFFLKVFENNASTDNTLLSFHSFFFIRIYFIRNIEAKIGQILRIF